MKTMFTYLKLADRKELVQGVIFLLGVTLFMFVSINIFA